jgi:hypothetical protein
MPCCSNARLPEQALGRRQALRALAGSLLVGSTVVSRAAQDPPLAESQLLTLARRSDGLFLSARLPVEISPAMEEVLRKGVPLHFLWQAEVILSRWYWLDKTVARAARTVRLAYQPLTRRWRLSYATGTPSATGLQYALHQNFDSLSEALASAGHVSSWKLADAARWNPGGEQRVEFSFALDLSQLPRPFQLGLFQQSGWNIGVQKTLPVPGQITPDDVPVAPMQAPSEDEA